MTHIYYKCLHYKHIKHMIWHSVQQDQSFRYHLLVLFFNTKIRNLLDDNGVFGLFVLLVVILV